MKHFKILLSIILIVFIVFSCNDATFVDMEQEPTRTATLLQVTAVENDDTDLSARKGKKNKKPAPAQTDNCNAPVVITFDDQGFESGDIVDVINTTAGNVTIYVEGENPVLLPGDNAAMIFDSSNPPTASGDNGYDPGDGDDLDLGTPNETYGGPGISIDDSGLSNMFSLENVLIVTEDGNSNHPDDLNYSNGKLHFDFSDIEGGATLVSIDVLDIENLPSPEAAYVLMLDKNGNEIKKLLIPEVGDNGFGRIDLENTPGVYDLTVRLGSSGAIDNLTYCWNLVDACIHEDDPNSAAAGNKNYNSYVFEFDDGTIISGSNNKNSVEVTVNNKTFIIHTSCSDDFSGPDGILGTDDDGYGAKDGPSPADGVRVKSYTIFKYKRKHKGPKAGECNFHKMCSNTF